jgi:hypothetical protein
MAREALLFGQQRSFNKLDEAIISIPTDEEVQAVLDEHWSQVAGPSSLTHLSSFFFAASTLLPYPYLKNK